MAAHPSPDPGVGKHLESILSVFSALGDLLGAFDGNFNEADDGLLDSKIDAVVEMVDAVMLAREVCITADSDRQ